MHPDIGKQIFVKGRFPCTFKLKASTLAMARRISVHLRIYLNSDAQTYHCAEHRNFKSEDPGSDPPVGLGDGQCSCPSESTLVQTLFAPNPPPPLPPPPPPPSPFVCTARIQICARVEAPVCTCRKRLGLTAGGMETRNHCA